jgi:hypothetical protein
MTRAASWLKDNEGWKSFLAFIYALICVFDFIVVPIWIGLNRPSNESIDQRLHQIHMHEMGDDIAKEMVKPLTYQHEPFTLKGGGLFHLSFGALLTGSALSRRNDMPK